MVGVGEAVEVLDVVAEVVHLQRPRAPHLEFGSEDDGAAFDFGEGGFAPDVSGLSEDVVVLVEVDVCCAAPVRSAHTVERGRIRRSKGFGTRLA